MQKRAFAWNKESHFGQRTSDEHLGHFFALSDNVAPQKGHRGAVSVSVSTGTPHFRQKEALAVRTALQFVHLFNAESAAAMGAAGAGGAEGAAGAGGAEGAAGVGGAGGAVGG